MVWDGKETDHFLSFFSPFLFLFHHSHSSLFISYLVFILSFILPLTHLFPYIPSNPSLLIQHLELGYNTKYEKSLCWHSVLYGHI